MNYCTLVKDESGTASKMYGINCNSILNQLKVLSCMWALLPDIMYDILEGSLQYEGKLLLHGMIDDKNYFNLILFNSRKIWS